MVEKPVVVMKVVPEPVETATRGTVVIALGEPVPVEDTPAPEPVAEPVGTAMLETAEPEKTDAQYLVPNSMTFAASPGGQDWIEQSRIP